MSGYSMQLSQLDRSATAETAHVTIRPIIVEYRLTLTVMLNMTYVNFISLTELPMCQVILSANMLNYFKNTLDE